MKKLLFLSLINILTTSNININAFAHIEFGFNVETEDWCDRSSFELNTRYYNPAPLYRHCRTFSGPIIVTRPVFRPVCRPIIIEHIERPVFDEPIYREKSRQAICSNDYCDIEDLEEAEMARLAKKTAKRHEQKLVVEKELKRQELERKARREQEIKQRIANQKAILEQAEQDIENLESELHRISK